MFLLQIHLSDITSPQRSFYLFVHSLLDVSLTSCCKAVVFWQDLDISHGYPQCILRLQSYFSTFYSGVSNGGCSCTDGKEAISDLHRANRLPACRIKQADDPRLAGLNTLTFSVWISRGAGLVLSVNVLLILLPMCRNLLRFVRPKLRFLPLDESQWFHRQCAYSLLFFTILHVTAHYVNFFNVERSQIGWKRPCRSTIRRRVASLVISCCCVCSSCTPRHITAYAILFRDVWYTHHLFIPFLLGMYNHATNCFVRDTTDPFSPFAGKPFWTHCIGYEGWRWELFGGGLYLIERLYREIRARRDQEYLYSRATPM